MNASKPGKTRLFRFPLRGLSYQQRLPLLICVLLLCIIVTFGWTSYLGVKKAALKAGQDRLLSLTGQLSSMFSESSQNYLTNIRTTAAQDTIKKFLLSNGKEFRHQSLTALQKLHRDSAT